MLYTRSNQLDQNQIFLVLESDRSQDSGFRSHACFREKDYSIRQLFRQIEISLVYCRNRFH